MNNNENPNSGSEEEKPRVSHLMTVSIVLGVLGSCVFLGMLASRYIPASLWFVFGPLLVGPAVGLAAIAQIMLSRGRVKGPLGIWEFLGIGLLMAVVLLVLFPVFARPHRTDYRCTSHMKQLGLGLCQYAQDYDDTLPTAREWNKALVPYTKSASVFRCPQDKDQSLPSYAMNRKTSGLRLKQVARPEELIVLFESLPGRNTVGGPELLPPKPRHAFGDNYCLADGHVERCRRDEESGLRWEPSVGEGYEGDQTRQ